MRSKITVLLALFALVFNATAFAATAGSNDSKSARRVQTLVNLLPASDAIVTVDVKRVFNDMLPRLLAAKPPMLADIMSKLDEMQTKTGLDLRKFDQVVIGVKMSQVPAKTDTDFVAITRGDINTGALLSLVKIGSNGKYRQEKVGDKTIYIVSVSDAAAKKPANAPKTQTAAKPKVEEIAITALDANTIAFGTIARVRETIAAKSTVSPELIGLLPVERSAIFAFAGKMPADTSKMLPLDNDELGKTIASIRYVSGWMDMTDAGALLRLMARTLQSDQAQNLFDTLQGLQMMGKAFLGNSKKPEQLVLARMVEGAKIDHQNNDVTIDLQVPQSDIDLLIGMIK